LRLIIYYLMFPVGLGLAIVCSIICGKNRIGARNSVLFTVTGFISGVLGAMVISYPYNLFLDRVYGEGGHDISRFSLFGALLFMPVLIAVIAKMTGNDFGTILDVCSPGVFAVLITGKIGCHIYGCCYGIPMDGGIINPQTGAAVFPVQLCEVLLCLLIMCGGLILLKRNKLTKGAVYPLLLLVYSLARFLLEFLRFNRQQEAAILGFADFWQCISIFATITAVLWIIFLKMKNNRLQKSV